MSELSLPPLLEFLAARSEQQGTRSVQLILEELNRQLRGLPRRSSSSPALQLPRIQRHLFERLGYRAVAGGPGDWTTYPEQVLVRKEGHPVVLAALIQAVGAQLGLPLEVWSDERRWCLRGEDSKGALWMEAESGRWSRDRPAGLTPWDPPSWKRWLGAAA